MVGVQALVSSGDDRAWLLTTQRSEGFEAERVVGLRMETSGSGTIAGLGKLGQTEVGRGMRAAGQLHRGASFGMMGTEER